MRKSGPGAASSERFSTNRRRRKRRPPHKTDGRCWAAAHSRDRLAAITARVESVGSRHAVMGAGSGCVSCMNFAAGSRSIHSWRYVVAYDTNMIPKQQLATSRYQSYRSPACRGKSAEIPAVKRPKLWYKINHSRRALLGQCWLDATQVQRRWMDAGRRGRSATRGWIDGRWLQSTPRAETRARRWLRGAGDRPCRLIRLAVGGLALTAIRSDLVADLSVELSAEQAVLTRDPSGCCLQSCQA